MQDIDLSGLKQASKEDLSDSIDVSTSTLAFLYSELKKTNNSMAQGLLQGWIRATQDLRRIFIEELKSR